MKTLTKKEVAFVEKLPESIFESKKEYAKAVREFLGYGTSRAIPVKFKQIFDEKHFKPKYGEGFKKFKALWENLPC
jgi:hypothetical protein